MNKLRLTLALLSLMSLTGPALAVEYYLRADVTEKMMPDGQIITMWGFAMDPNFSSETGEVTVPGPTLEVPPGDDTLIIHLKNNLTLDKLIYTAYPVSIVIPSLPAAMTPQRFPAGGLYPQFAGRIRNLTYDTAPGNTVPVDYVWTNVRPGSYIYFSGNHIASHVQMGLYGAVIKNSDVNQAYPAGPTRPAADYNQAVNIFYSEIDPNFHLAVATGNYGPGKNMTSTIEYHPRYYLVNGQPYVVGQTPLLTANTDQTILLRFFNAGLETHVPQLQNLRGTLLAEDAWPFNYTTDQYSFVLQSLKTKDVLIQPTIAGRYPVYDRRLRLTNANVAPGGLLSFLEITEPGGGPLSTECPADLDNSGVIDLIDLALLTEAWLTPCTGCLADLNADNLVNLADYTIWVTNHQTGCP